MSQVLGDSVHRGRPAFGQFLTSDACSSGRSTRAGVSLAVDSAPSREKALPPVTGRGDVVSFEDVSSPKQPGFKRWNDTGVYRAAVPLRAVDGALDPVSGFVSVGGRLFPVAYSTLSPDDNRMPNLDQLSIRPNQTIPKVFTPVLYKLLYGIDILYHY